MFRAEFSPEADCVLAESVAHDIRCSAQACSLFRLAFLSCCFFRLKQSILHGFFFIPNFLRSCLTGSLYIALDHTTAYTVFYCISAVASLPAIIYIVVRPGRFKKNSHHPDTLPDIKTH